MTSKFFDKVKDLGLENHSEIDIVNEIDILTTKLKEARVLIASVYLTLKGGKLNDQPSKIFPRASVVKEIEEYLDKQR